MFILVFLWVTNGLHKPRSGLHFWLRFKFPDLLLEDHVPRITYQGPGARAPVSAAETGLTTASAARVIGMVPQIGAWAGFCSNDAVSGRNGEADPLPLPFHTFSAILSA